MIAPKTSWEDIPHTAPDELPWVQYRVIIAKRVLVAGYEDDTEPEPLITDMLTDLRHLADALELEWEGLLERSYISYLVDTAITGEEKK